MPIPPALLMMAEIENGLNNPCASYINEVRKRAYGDTFEENKYTEGSYAENELAILQERDKEFVSEGKRWFDVLRMHDASGRSLVFFCRCQLSGHNPILGTEEAYKMLWPVNIGTLNVNPLLTQTPGYGKKISQILLFIFLFSTASTVVLQFHYPFNAPTVTPLTKCF